MAFASGNRVGEFGEFGHSAAPESPTGDNLSGMRRATITLPDDLTRAVESYIDAQDAPPSLTAVVQAALRRYLTEQGYLRTRKTLRIEPAAHGSGRSDVSKSHDSYLAGS
jgi:hypothetical protein